MQSRTVLSQDVCLSVCLFVRHSPVLCGISLLPDVLKCRPTDQTCSWLHRCGPCSLDRRHRRMTYEYICRCGIEIAPSHRNLTSFTARCHVMVEKNYTFPPRDGIFPPLSITLCAVFAAFALWTFFTKMLFIITCTVDWHHHPHGNI